LFDGADPNASTAIRSLSTTPLQSLFAMNDPFVHERAARLAAHLASVASEESKRLDLAFLTVYGRYRRGGRTCDIRRLLTRITEKKKLPRDQAWNSLCRVLLTANEFLYVD
jgi:hypothetical protein